MQATVRALDALRRGDVALVAEDMTEGGALWAVAGAQFATAALVNRLANDAQGVLSVTLSRARAKALDCGPLDRKRAPAWLPHYGTSVEAATGVSTGISAEDRGLTARLLADPEAGAVDFVRPGHIMPTIVADRGVLAAPYGCEAAHDLVVAAGLHPAALVSHVLHDVDQAMADHGPLVQAQTGWPLVRVSDVIAWRAHHERLVRVLRQGEVATRNGPFRVRVYASDLDGSAHMALVRGSPESADGPALVRLHSQCLTGDILHSRRCDCGGQLQLALERLAAAEVGALLYLRQEGRGIGLIAKIRAYALQDQGKDTVEANEALGFAPDERDYAVAAQILRDLGLARIVLMTNNPAKVDALRRFGIDVVDRQGIEVAPTSDNRRYLQTKRDRMGHLLELPSA
ncbi:MAG: GTP cyclohydrolase II [Deltaproteobacteria bacterium]|nr:GTP cyclohydrolase II [Deltaproteobacteria bacterium]